MRLTKTELELLELAASRGGFAAITTLYGRGSRGGRVSGGIRERNALFKLVDLGLVKITERAAWQDYNRGYGQGGNIITFQLCGVA
jgi:hypothetical protein